jgi:tetratricopeptide (TPR) repeat protein
VNINPNDAQVWCSLGLLYYATGQYREALGMLSRAVKLEPEMTIAWHNIGTLYELSGQTEDALLAFTESRKHSNQHADQVVANTLVGQGGHI